MEWFNTDVSPTDTSLQEAPELLKAVSVDTSVDVLDSMVNDLMGVLTGKSIIGKQSVRVESRASFNMFFNLSLKSFLFAVCDDRRAHFSAALKDSHDGDLVFGASPGDAPLALADMHVASLAANESFVSFDFARQLSNRLVMHSLTDAMHHEPSRLLGNSEGTSDLTRANSVLAVAEQPEATHPLIQTQRRVLKDSADFKAELPLAAITLPDTPGFDEGVFFGTTARARNYTVRPAKVDSALKSAVGIAEMDDGFLKCVRRFHDSNVRLLFPCVNYINAQIYGTASR